MSEFQKLARRAGGHPWFQQLFMAFTVGLFLSCAASVSDAHGADIDPAARSSIVVR